MANNPQDNVIPGFEKLSKQELFDMAAAHVLKNGCPSVDPYGACSYRGIGCAAAPFLTAEARSACVGSWSALAEGYKGHKVPRHEAIFIQRLQRCHDRNSRVEDFINNYKEDMRELALVFDLSPAILG